MNREVFSFVVLAALAACSDSHGRADREPIPPGYTWEPRCETPVPGRGAAVCSAPCTAEPVTDGTTTGRRNNCCNPSPPALAPASWWVAEPPGACLDDPRIAPARTQPHWGDRCETSISGYNDLHCGAAPQVVCRAIEEEPERLRWDAVLMDWWVEGALMSTCRSSLDCPDGTVCVDAGRRLAPGEMATSSSGGDCMQACDPAAPGPCLFCGWTCGDEGFCTSETPAVGPPCVADCQCPRPWNLCVHYEDGTAHCASGGGGFGGTLFCDPGTGAGNCACTGGTCEMIPDGNIGCCYTREGDLVYRLDDPRRDAVCGEFAP